MSDGNVRHNDDPMVDVDGKIDVIDVEVSIITEAN